MPCDDVEGSCNASSSPQIMLPLIQQQRVCTAIFTWVLLMWLCIDLFCDLLAYSLLQ